jgi:cytochrome c-type biogenesis protein
VSQFIEAFTLGNAAILSNVCLLPLYPGLIVMLAGRATPATTPATTAGDDRPASRWQAIGGRLLGLVVLAGVITFMVVLGFVLHQVQRSVADVLDWVLPIVYGLVIVMAVFMLLDRNPFTRLATVNAPVMRSPLASSYLYGMFLAPMTLPCTGPIVVSAFVLGGVGGTSALLDQLWYFVAFALGFGWPLVVLPFFAVSLQRRATRWLARHHRLVSAVSGVLMLMVAGIGLWVDLRPAIT